MRRLKVTMGSARCSEVRRTRPFLSTDLWGRRRASGDEAWTKGTQINSQMATDLFTPIREILDRSGL
jgi:hypothetical protein